LGSNLSLSLSLRVRKEQGGSGKLGFLNNRDLSRFTHIFPGRALGTFRHCIAVLIEENKPIIMLSDHKEEDYTI
jgi:hypothetical protein